MSDSPRPEPEEEKQEKTPDDNEQRNSKEMSPDEGALGLDIEVKEQDRWLPIANGELHSYSHHPEMLRPCAPFPYVTQITRLG